MISAGTAMPVAVLPDCSMVARNFILASSAALLPGRVWLALVLCKGACFSLGAFDAVQDLVGVLGPGEGARVLVPVVDVGADGVGELADCGEGPAADGLAGDHRKEAFPGV